jgi:hypothetical protein
LGLNTARDERLAPCRKLVLRAPFKPGTLRATALVKEGKLTRNLPSWKKKKAWKFEYLDFV